MGYSEYEEWEEQHEQRPAPTFTDEEYHAMRVLDYSQHEWEHLSQYYKTFQMKVAKGL